MTNFM